MISVDLNCDLGESFGAYTIGMDEAVIPLITSANVACGYHAGDPLVMAKTVARCREAGVHVGAHPGFPDLMGFGRRSMNVSPAEAKAYIQYQLGALAAFCRAAGVPLATSSRTARSTTWRRRMKSWRAPSSRASARWMTASSFWRSAEAKCCSPPKRPVCAPTASEVFADRGYQSDGTLVPRTQPGAMITDETLAMGTVVRMVTEGVVTAVDGTDIPLARIPSSMATAKKRRLFRPKDSRRAGSKGRRAEGAVSSPVFSPSHLRRNSCGQLLFYNEIVAQPLFRR